jgi:hypothetical protein
LARDNLGVEGGASSTFPGGAARLVGGRGVVLAGEEPDRALGRALAWANQHGATEIDLLVDEAAGALARRASEFTIPITVWWVQGRELHAVDPEPLAAPSPPDARAVALAPVLTAAGADVVIEDGVVKGEVLGLEVARVVLDGGDARIEVGVGRHDREAFAMVHGNLPAPEALAKVVAAAREHRSAGPVDHPLRRLVQERWLREIVLTEPAVVGAAALERVEVPVLRDSVKDVIPAAAAGTDPHGEPVIVVCSVGIDIDLVPIAADVRLQVNPAARLVLAVPERDDHHVTRALAALLRRPAEVVAIPGDWRAAAPA